MPSWIEEAPFEGTYFIIDSAYFSWISAVNFRIHETISTSGDPFQDPTGRAFVRKNPFDTSPIGVPVKLNTKRTPAMIEAPTHTSPLE